MRHPSRSIVIAAVATCLACGSKRDAADEEASHQPSPPQTEPTTRTAHERIRVAVDERIELFAILFRLAESPEYQTGAATEYTRAVDAHFAQFRNHAAVVASRELRAKNGISYNAPVGLAVYLDTATALAPIRSLVPPPGSLDERWQRVAISDYLAAVRAFVADTGFDGFMAGHRDYFRAVEARYRDSLDLPAVAAWFDRFFGARTNLSAAVVPGLLTGQSNYAATAELGNDTQVFYQVVGLTEVDSEGLPRVDHSTLHLLVHEMAHGYINPLFETHRRVLEGVGRQLYARVAEVMAKQAYGSWETVLNESGVRAATVLCLLDVSGEQLAVQSLAFDERQSFSWIAGLTEVFAEHRGRRRGAAEPAELVAETAAFLRAWLAAHREDLPQAPFRGPIDAALGADDEQTLYVVPGRSTSATPLATYVRGIRDQLSPKSTIVGADELGTQGKRAATLVVYGSPSENPMVSSLLDRFGWRVTAEGIHLGDHPFTGSDLVLIACHPHPDDPTHAVVLYTAAGSETLAAPNQVWHGTTDWVVARHRGGKAYEIVAQGDFAKTLPGEWSASPVSRNP